LPFIVTRQEIGIGSCYHTAALSPNTRRTPLETSERPKRRSRAYWLLLAVGLVLLALLIAHIGPQKMLTAWRQANKSLLAAGVALFLAGLLVRGVKWRLFLSVTPHRVRYVDALRAYVLNAFFANLTPARTGEVFAPVWLGRHGVPTATGFAVMIVDRMLDLVVVLSFFAVAVWNLNRLAPVDTAVYRTAGIAALIIVAAMLIVVLLALARLDLAIGFLSRFSGRAAVRVRGALSSFRDALVPFRHRRVLAANLGLTALTWLMDLTTSFFVVRSVLPTLTWSASATASLFATAAALASFVPGGIGVGAVGFTAVIALLGYDATAAGAGAVLMTLLTQLVRAAAAGLLAMKSER
jgi:uncharacterized protein (TIRG00374 family)